MEILLNEKLLKERKISKTKQKKILDLHKQLAYIKSRPEEFEIPLKAVADIEFQLQALWDFLLIKGCTDITGTLKGVNVLRWIISKGLELDTAYTTQNVRFTTSKETRNEEDYCSNVYDGGSVMQSGTC